MNKARVWRFLGTITLVRPALKAFRAPLPQPHRLIRLLRIAGISTAVATALLVALIWQGGEVAVLVSVSLIGLGAGGLEWYAADTIKKGASTADQHLQGFGPVQGLMRFWLIVSGIALVLGAFNAVMVVLLLGGVGIALAYYLFFGLLYLVLIVATMGAIFNDPGRPKGLENAFEFFTALPRSFFETEKQILGMLGIEPAHLGGALIVFFVVVPLLVSLFVLLRLKLFSPKS